MPEQAYVGAGSNLGDRRQNLDRGLTTLCSLPEVQLRAVSSVYETSPVGMADQPDFLNAVIAVRSDLPAPALLQRMQEIEAEHGRQRAVRWGPRTLDLDLLLFGSDTVDMPCLRLPHPRMHERAFVLVPLCEIAPNLRDPVTGEPYAAYLARLDSREQVRPAGRLDLLGGLLERV